MRGIIVGTLVLFAACGDDGGSDMPEITGASLATDEDAPIAHTVEASDPQGRALALSAQPPMHGTVAVDRLRITYTPSPNYNGPDSFTITVTNSVLQASAVIDVMVRPVNDAPAAGGDAFAATEDTQLVRTHAALLANDVDVDGDALTVMSVGGPVNGTVSSAGTDVTFTPTPDFNGTASYQYTVTDGKVTSMATVMISVGGANDTPVAADDTANTQEDTPLAIAGTALVANDLDPEGQTLTVTAVGNATNGSVALDSGTATFTPAANFSGTGTFEYTVSDGAATDTGTVTVMVAAVNDPPAATDDSTTTAEDTPVQLTSAALLTNDTDVEGQALTVTAVGNATNGAVVLAGGIATFTPAANFSGTGTFEYTVSDGTDTDTGTVSITVTAVNDPPVAGDDTAMTAEDTQLVIAVSTLLVNDSDVEGASLSVTAVSGAINGTAVLAGGNVTFTPAANFSGTASFSYTLSDGTAIDTGVVSITVTPVNDPPVAADDTSAVQTGNDLVIAHATLLANDVDVDGQALAVTAVQNAVNGVAVLGATAVTFTPSSGFVGTASFEYVVGDGTATDVGAVTITVSATPVCGDGTIASPEMCDDGNTAPGDGCSAACTTEPGWNCAGEPSACTEICGDGLRVGDEACDDGNADDTDGCTTLCVIGAPCTAVALPGADRFGVDPGTGHCYASYDDEMTTFAGAQSACVAAGGYLVTITSVFEQSVAQGVQNPVQNPWIGASEDGDTNDAIFDWVTDEAFTLASFAPGQPDNDAPFGGNGDCLHILDASGGWNDTNCNINTFVVGRICEIEPDSCGDSVFQPVAGEECEDGNTTAGDGCSATCQLENGCGNGSVEAGEECDDDNTASGDGCSAACQIDEGCGDGNTDAGEECDDDNATAGDGCSATCQLENGCGNGALDTGEECDDDNTTSGDGCSAACLIDAGCGDGDTDAGEECDDDNATAGDGCSATCQLENGCGDGNLDMGEQCDDDNLVGGDSCSATCQNELLSIFTFTGAAGNEVTFLADGAAPAPGLAAKPVITRGPGLDTAAAANEFSSERWQLTAVLDLTDYYSITITPAAGFTLSLSGIELDERRSLSGPLFWSVRSSLDGFTTDLVVKTLPDNDVFRRDQRVVFNPVFSNLTAPVELRIYGWDSEGSLGTWRLDNVELFGITAPSP